MRHNSTNTLVTGGAGFIGSHLCDHLLKGGHSVVAVDDLSLGRMDNLQAALSHPRFTFRQIDCLDKEALSAVFRGEAVDTVFHLAANSDIPRGITELRRDFERTFMTTFRVLECMDEHSVSDIVFSSSSAVYGELSTVLHEDSGPLHPISHYGAAKLASEAFISAFVHSRGLRAWIIRFPNVVGERATHGVLYDFLAKLKKNPVELEILGDGSQKKPNLYVKDLVDGMLQVWKSMQGQLNCINIGVDDGISVSDIADILFQETGLTGIRKKFTGGDRGWMGDVPTYRYDTSRMKALGWSAPRSSKEAVRTAVRQMLEQ